MTADPNNLAYLVLRKDSFEKVLEGELQYSHDITTGLDAIPEDKHGEHGPNPEDEYASYFALEPGTYKLGSGPNVQIEIKNQSIDDEQGQLKVTENGVVYQDIGLTRSADVSTPLRDISNGSLEAEEEEAISLTKLTEIKLSGDADWVLEAEQL